MKIAHICCVLVIGLVSVCSSYRILGVFPFNAKSHDIVFEALVKGLAKRGHQVDLITHFPPKKPVKNVNVVVNLDGSLRKLVNNYTIEYVLSMRKVGSPASYISRVFGNDLCHFMGFKEMQNLIKNPPKDPPYDLVIVEAFAAHCYMGFGYVFNVPVVAIVSAIEFPWITSFIGNDDNPTYVSNIYQIGDGKKMNFFERFLSWFYAAKATFLFQYLTEESQTSAMRKYLHPNIPSIREVEKNVSLTLVNANPIFGIKPITPALVQIGGLHIEETDQTLSPELQKWMDESKHGVVYFTFGSMVLIESLYPHMLKGIYASFEKIAPVRVLMKVADNSKLPPGLPSNVKTIPWIPQQAVLAHPNTKVFITHGGLGGVQEALYFGVPLIGIPLFGDQFFNVNIFVQKGMALQIELTNISEVTFDSSLKSILQNPKFKERAAYLSKLYKDQPISPMNSAIFWIEYVIRNGGDVLRSPALQLSWWQLDKLDIYGTILFVTLFSIYFLVLSVKFAVKTIIRLRKCDKNNNNKKINKKNNNNKYYNNKNYNKKKMQ